MHRILGIIIIIASIFGGFVMMQKTDSQKITNRIYLAGGCFWGVEAYFSKITGSYKDRSRLCKRKKRKNPTYEEVSTGNTSFAENCSY